MPFQSYTGGLARFLRFGLVGASALLIQVCLLVVAVEYFVLDIVVASAASYLVAAAANYLMNRVITFRSKQSHRQTVPRFIAMVASGVLVNTLVMAILVRVFEMPYLAAQFCTALVVLLWNYQLSARWVFSVDSAVVTK